MVPWKLVEKEKIIQERFKREQDVVSAMRDREASISLGSQITGLYGKAIFNIMTINILIILWF